MNNLLLDEYITNLKINKSQLDEFNKIIIDMVINKIIEDIIVCTYFQNANLQKQGLSYKILSEQEAIINIDSMKNIKLNSQCIQQSIKQIDIKSIIAQIIFNILLQNTSKDNLTKLINQAKKNFAGTNILNPLTSSPPSDINMNLDIYLDNNQINDMDIRKLSNLIGNTVSQNLNKNIVNCFSENITNNIIYSYDLKNKIRTCEELHILITKILNYLIDITNIKIGRAHV